MFLVRIVRVVLPRRLVTLNCAWARAIQQSHLTTSKSYAMRKLHLQQRNTIDGAWKKWGNAASRVEVGGNAASRVEQS
eukprot:1920208-Rhodomonas_salina.1